MIRDPQRLADIGADARPEDRLLATLIEQHRQGRPAATGLRALTRRLEAHAAPETQGGLLRLSLAGASAVVCAAVVVSALRGTSPATSLPPEGGAARSAELVAPALASPSHEPEAKPEPARAADALRESPAAVSVHSLPSDSSGAREGAGATPSSTAPPASRRTKGVQSKSACDESELIDRAETLLRTGQPARALELTRAHAACGETVLVQERERIAIEALVALGRHEEARARARVFETNHASSPHLRRIRQLVGLGAE